MAKTIIIGIDGACWEYLTPLLEEGRLPNIKKLIDRGSSGVLESVLPPISPVVWSSLITGTNPGKHGIFGWMIPERKDCHVPVNTTMRKAPPFWRHLNEKGLRVGVFNIPVTYPTEEINGYIIPGFEAPTSCEDSVYPKELYMIIKEKYNDFLNKLPLDFLSDFKALAEIGIESYFQKYCFSEEMRTCLALDLTLECDVVLFNYMITDHLNHQLKEFEFVKKAYNFVDKMVGRWLEKFPDENYILMSDHGSTRIKGIVNLNHLFFNKGFLQLKKRQIDSLSKEEVNEILNRILLRRGLKPGIYEKMLRRLKLFWLYVNTENYRFNRLKALYELNPEGFNSFLYLSQIDYEKSLLHVNSDDGFIFLNTNYLKEQEMNNKQYFKQLINELLSFKDPLSNKSFFSFILEKETLFKGNQVKQAPELYGHFFESTCFVSTRINYSTFKSTDPWRKTEDVSDIGVYGSHQRNGIYITSGPYFKKVNSKSQKLYSLLDVTPTVYYLQNVAIPENFDGKVMKDILAPEYIRNNKIKYRTDDEYSSRASKSEITADDKQQIIKRLRLLGYID